MSTLLVENSYGASRVRLVKVARSPGRHTFKELTVGVQFEGDFEKSFTAGENANILPADTIKNTVYALAKLYSIEQIEEFAQTVIDHFLTDNPQVLRVIVEIAEQLWNRVSFGGKPHPSAFTPAGPEKRTTSVSGTRNSVSIESGIQDLVLLKTAGAGFEGYRRDPFTTLQSSADQVLATSVNARWRYADTEITFGTYWHGIRETILETFIEHESRSLQHTSYVMGEAVLERYHDILEISLSLPNRGWVPAELSKLGLENENDVFIPLDEPHEMIQARVRRG
ncbi:MAG: urate oxidase [Acidobacteriota bacterium]|nr:urate oxidase [Acidobacteriota bacterium]